MNQVFAIVMCILIACACGYYAQLQGRNRYVWFFIGLIFGIFGLFLLFLIPMLQQFMKKRLMKNRPEPAISPPVIELYTESSYLQKLWYYLDQSNNQLGPMSFPALKQAWKEGKVQPSTYVWNEELPSWKRFDEICKAKEQST